MFSSFSLTCLEGDFSSPSSEEVSPIIYVVMQVKVFICKGQEQYLANSSKTRTFLEISLQKETWPQRDRVSRCFKDLGTR